MLPYFKVNSPNLVRATRIPQKLGILIVENGSFTFFPGLQEGIQFGRVTFLNKKGERMGGGSKRGGFGEGSGRKEGMRGIWDQTGKKK